MINALTGDYDAVVQFSFGAVDRILAAMHANERFPHSLSMYVDDLPDLTPRFGSVVNSLGKAVADIAVVRGSALNLASPDSRPPELRTILFADPLVNAVNGSFVPPDAGSAPSVSLYGVVLAQLGAPTLRVPHGNPQAAEIHTPVMIRWVGDPGSRVIAPFLRGEVVITIKLSQAAGPNGNQLVVSPTSVVFHPEWTDMTLSEVDQAAINAALGKSIAKDFLPSSAKHPDGFKALDFVGYPDDDAMAILTNVTTQNDPNPLSVPSVFLAENDQFALGVNGDVLAAEFQSAVDDSVTHNLSFNTTVTIGGGSIDLGFATIDLPSYTYHIRTDASIGLSRVVLEPTSQQIVLTIPIHVNNSSQDAPGSFAIPSDFDFSLTQEFNLSLVGSMVVLNRLGDVTVNLPGSVPGYLGGMVTQNVHDSFNSAWNEVQNNVQDLVAGAFSVKGVQGFVNSLIAPFSRLTEYLHPQPPPQATLTYTSVQVQPAGVVVHGGVSISAWPAVEVTFDKDPLSTRVPEYRALNSWIPGGTINEYRWQFGRQGGATDANRFITVSAPELAAAADFVCMSVYGQRITAAGSVLYDGVFAGTRCRFYGFPFGFGKGLHVKEILGTVLPKPGLDPDGKLEVAANAPLSSLGAGANLIIHFPDEVSLPQTRLLIKSLNRAGRTDALTSVVCVLNQDQIGQARLMPGLTYADGASKWEKALGVRHRPATLILDPTGRTVWRQDSKTDFGAITAAMRTHLTAGGWYSPRLLEPLLTPGLPAPNFTFDYLGVRTTLRRISGRASVLVFFNSSSHVAVETIRHLESEFEPLRDVAPLLLAIAEGEDANIHQLGSYSIVVPDPGHRISRAYGVQVWPTVVFLDDQTNVQQLYFGRVPRVERGLHAHA